MVRKYKCIQSEAIELFERKNADYGDAFAEYGTVGVLVRMGDKIKRLQTIEKNSVSLVCDEKLAILLLTYIIILLWQ